MNVHITRYNRGSVRSQNSTAQDSSDKYLQTVIKAQVLSIVVDDDDDNNNNNNNNNMWIYNAHNVSKQAESEASWPYKALFVHITSFVIQRHADAVIILSTLTVIVTRRHS